MAAEKVVALIPARGGSQRVPRKNIRELAGHPLIAYTIAVARSCGLFSGVYVSTDDAETMEIARHYGAETIARPAELARADSPDIDWVRHALYEVAGFIVVRQQVDAFAILRPTSPFRRTTTIEEGLARLDYPEWRPVDSVRAVTPASQHPGKMWRIIDGAMYPILPYTYAKGDDLEMMGYEPTPWHSSPTQTLPKVWIQTASMEFSRPRNVDHGTISGSIIAPLMTFGYEALDINDESDWAEAERITAEHPKALPKVEVR